MITYEITTAQQELLDLIEEVHFGEILDYEFEEGDRTTITVELTGPQVSLVKLINTGVVSFHLIKIHDGDPTYAETMERSKAGYTIKKLYKLK